MIVYSVCLSVMVKQTTPPPPNKKKSKKKKKKQQQKKSLYLLQEFLSDIYNLWLYFFLYLKYSTSLAKLTEFKKKN